MQRLPPQVVTGAFRGCAGAEDMPHMAVQAETDYQWRIAIEWLDWRIAVLRPLEEFKDAVKAIFGLSDALIHVNVGLAVFLAVALVLRKKERGALIAWGVVVVLQVANEMVDAWVGMVRHGGINFTEAWKDTVATVFWPTVMLLVWRPLTNRASKRSP